MEAQNPVHSHIHIGMHGEVGITSSEAACFDDERVLIEMNDEDMEKKGSFDQVDVGVIECIGEHRDKKEGDL